MTKELGKISSVHFGYDEYRFGLSLSLTGDGWGTNTGYYYNPNYPNECNEHHSVEMLAKVQTLMKSAKEDDVANLKGKPIEATFENMLLKDFRILTEVL